MRCPVAIRVMYVVASATFVAAGAQGQTTWNVDDDNCPGPGTGSQVDPFCKIQDAINAASDGDEVVVAPGTYNETIDFIGKAITLRSSGGADVTTIDATGLNDSVVKCMSGEGPDTVLEGFTITGGNASNGGGGGMYNERSSPTVTNCIFTGNTASYGGGMFNGGSPTVTNCTFSGNSAAGGGGGMFNGNSSTTVINCAFSDNMAGVSGGGMYNNNNKGTVSNCTFSGNASSLGGGMHSFISSNLTVSNCTFSGNIADNGGGMYNGASDTTVSNCTFSGNIADNGGGGMYNGASDPMVTNCTFTGNSADADGGAIFNDGGSINLTTLINCTFSANLANRGGGVFIGGVRGPIIINCILWGNADNDGMEESAQIFVESDTRAPVVMYSLIQGLDSFRTGAGNIAGDPLFGPLFVDISNGDLRLRPNSAAIDAGLSIAIPLDLDLNLRIVDHAETPNTGLGFPTVIDMGAFEFGSVPPLPSDFDNDRDVDLRDFSKFAQMFTGP